MRHEVLPFCLAALVMVFVFLTLAVSYWPNIVPPNLTIENAAASPSSLQFLFSVGGLICVPVIIVYTGMIYWVFRGKVHEGRRVLKTA